MPPSGPLPADMRFFDRNGQASNVADQTVSVARTEFAVGYLPELSADPDANAVT